MAIKVKLQDTMSEAADILVRKAPGELHDRLSRLLAKEELRTGKRPTKPSLIVELLDTHPKMKAIK